MDLKECTWSRKSGIMNFLTKMDNTNEREVTNCEEAGEKWSRIHKKYW